MSAELAVVCVHATRRARRGLRPGEVSEHRCYGCHATILVSAITLALGRQRRATLYLLCTSCSIETAGPDERQAFTIPGTRELLERHGIANAQARLDALADKSIRELAANALRNTVGGQG